MNLWGQANGFERVTEQSIILASARVSTSTGESWRDLDEILKACELMQGQDKGTQGALSP